MNTLIQVFLSAMQRTAVNSPLHIDFQPGNRNRNCLTLSDSFFVLFCCFFKYFFTLVLSVKVQGLKMTLDMKQQHTHTHTHTLYNLRHRIETQQMYDFFITLCNMGKEAVILLNCSLLFVKPIRHIQFIFCFRYSVLLIIIKML